MNLEEKDLLNKVIDWLKRELEYKKLDIDNTNDNKYQKPYINDNKQSIDDIEKNNNLLRSGWICPKCGAVYSPDVTECWKCNITISPYYPMMPGYYCTTSDNLKCECKNSIK